MSDGSNTGGRVKAWRELTVELLVAYKWPIVIAISILVGAVLWLDPDLPTITISMNQKAMGVSALLAAVIAAAPVDKILAWLFDPPVRFMVSLGFRADLPAGIWSVTPGDWRDMKVVEGELYQWPNTIVPVYECDWFDEDALEVKGTRRGSMSDRELLEEEKKVEELRTRLEKQADRSVDLELSISSRVRQAVRAIGQAIIDEHASASIYEGEEVADVLSDIREDVEQDAVTTEDRGDNGEKPVRDAEALQAGLDLLDQVDKGVPGDD